MKLFGKENSFFELTILGYQFPEITDDEWDSNWLKIQCNIKLPFTTSKKSWELEWGFTDSCLDTVDIYTIAQWFESIVAKKEVTNVLEFTEPILEFNLIESTYQFITLRIYFELEGRPGAWDNFPMRDIWIDLKVTREDLKSAANSLREYLIQFPPRAIKNKGKNFQP